MNTYDMTILTMWIVLAVFIIVATYVLFFKK